MLRYDNQFTVGPSGTVNRTRPSGFPHAEAGSVWVSPKYSFDLSDALPGGSKVEWLCGSIDGQCWLAKCAIPDTDSRYDKLCVSFTRDGSGNLEAAEVLILDGAGDPVQTGRDWILTQKYFLAHGTVDGEPDRVYREIIRQMPLLFPNGSPVPRTVGKAWYDLNLRETNWLFSYADYAPGKAPFWERLNEPVRGLQILHDFIIPRADKGFILPSVTAPQPAYARHAIKYFVREPENYIYGQPVWADTPNNYVYSAHWSDPYESVIIDSYAVFVLDGGIYVRAKNMFGSGRLIFPGLFDSGAYGDTAYILCMADYDVWAKNYPDFDWDRSCLGKIGGVKVLFETKEDTRAALELGITRYAASGRYIPIIDKVDPGADRDGTDAGLIPPMKELTGPEGEELSLYLSGCVTGALNNAVGVNYDKDIVKIISLDAHGDEASPPGGGLCLKGANAHIMPGDSPVIAQTGPYLFSKDKTKVFATDIAHTFRRCIYDMSGIGAAVSQKKENSPDSPGTMNVTETAALMGISNDDSGVLLMEDIVSATASAPGRASGEEYIAGEGLGDLEIKPVSFRNIRATGAYIDGNGALQTAGDVYEDALPAWNFPILINTSSSLSKETYILEQTGQSASGVPYYRYRFAWINPATGEVTPTVQYPLDPARAGSLGVEYTPKDGTIRFGECKQTYPDPVRIVNEFAVPEYLNGWVGSSDNFYVGAANFGPKCPGGMVVNATLASGGLLGMKYGPACEFYDQLPAFAAYYNYSESAHNRMGTVYTVDGLENNICGAHFSLPAWGPAIYFSATFAEDETAGKIIMFARNGSGVAISSDRSSLFSPSRPHHASATCWGVLGDTKTYHINPVCMAHYVYHPSMFRTLPNIYSDAGYTDEIETYRYARQVNVMKCRKGMADQNGYNLPAMPWAEHAFICFEVLVDPDEFNKLLEPLRILNPIS
ncbi:MAG: hypothetical protein LBL26_06190 [Peptococcaceae bacterium]|jgi:hypothetical protein|nr:hypothetical protein [Peptococcaceae bacterium]